MPRSLSHFVTALGCIQIDTAGHYSHESAPMSTGLATGSMLSSPRVHLTLAQRAADRRESAAYVEGSAQLDDQSRWGQQELRSDQLNALVHTRSAGTSMSEAAEEQCEWARGGEAIEDRHTAWSPEDQMRWSRDAELEATLEAEAAQSKLIQRDQEMIRQLQEALKAETQARTDAEAALNKVLLCLVVAFGLRIWAAAVTCSLCSAKSFFTECA